MTGKSRDPGHASIELALAVALLLIPTALVTLGFGPWTERTVLAESMAAEAARTAVLSLSLEDGAATVDAISANYGLEVEEVRIGWCGSEPEVSGAGACALSRGSVVEVTIEVWVPLVSTPWGPIGGLWVRGEHTEPVDLYRSLG